MEQHRLQRQHIGTYERLQHIEDTRVQQSPLGDGVDAVQLMHARRVR
jgi:hypothetical protein